MQDLNLNIPDLGDVEEVDTWSPIRKDWLDGTDDYLRK